MTLSSPADGASPAAPPTIDALIAGARARFDAATDGTMGIEEEFAICDPTSLDLLPNYTDLAAKVDEFGLTDAVAGELLASEIEFRTGRCDGWMQADEELTDIRRRAVALARASDVLLAASATHPWADYREQETVPLPYYQQLVERLQYVAHRNNTFGLHVHVGVHGADRAIKVADALRVYQPMLLALSSSSPFLDERDTGMSSVRHMIFSRNFIRGNVAPAFGTLDGYERYLRWLRESGSIDTAGQLWWGTRPHIVHGTIELRMFDGQPDVRDATALAALATGLIAHLCALHDAGELPEPIAEHYIDENCWRAARYGTSAWFVDLPGATQVSAPEAIGQLIADARAAGTASGLNIDAGLDRAQQMLEAGSSAAWQRELFAHTGNLRTVYRAVADATMSSSDEA